MNPQGMTPRQQASTRTRATAATIAATTSGVPFPGLVIIDTREQAPFAFADLNAGSRQQYRPLIIPTTCRALPAGDYSLDGHENEIAIERKSLNDLYGTLGQHRGRFQRELVILDAIGQRGFAAVVIESDWSTIIEAPPRRSQLHPKSVFGSVIAWQQQYPRIHWWATPDRVFAERVTFRILERFWVSRHSKAQTRQPIL